MSLDEELCRDVQMVSRAARCNLRSPARGKAASHIVVGPEGLSGMIGSYAHPVLHDVTAVSTYGGEIIITGANFGSGPTVVVQWDPRAASAGAHAGNTTPPMIEYAPIEEGEHESSFDRSASDINDASSTRGEGTSTPPTMTSFAPSTTTMAELCGVTGTIE